MIILSLNGGRRILQFVLMRMQLIMATGMFIVVVVTYWLGIVRKEYVSGMISKSGIFGVFSKSPTYRHTGIQALIF